jgi:hypothetical protein
MVVIEDQQRINKYFGRAALIATATSMIMEAADLCQELMLEMFRQHCDGRMIKHFGQIDESWKEIDKWQVSIEPGQRIGSRVGAVALWEGHFHLIHNIGHTRTQNAQQDLKHCQ